ncbi:hypothetical protein NA57DRAFT_67725 [Rhizodiscina lignyota]|uniref:NACHT domain-containing protein n=1 Tax=Rhizodiscina lignyota TaxID=1504668 RepID=A0A9P4ICR7_9PEZI|nr:hypothetical protein NA57DRAFT_67725 [Rhizodiscina lignyota]
MAEIVALAASIISIVQIADRVVALCRGFIKASKDAPHDLRLIMIEVSSVKCILDALHLLLDSGSSVSLVYLQGPDGPVEGCRRCLDELEALFPADYLETSKRKRQKVRAMLAWPLRESTARKLLDELGRHLNKETRRDVRGIRKTLSDSQKAEVLDWLQHTNPSRRHNTMRALHEPHTCQWRLLWIYGVPGAGKTVLAAFLVEEVKRWIQQNALPRHNLAYYYCYYAHNQDEALPFLRWVLSQLLREADHMPKDAYELFNKRHHPDLRALLNGLEGVLQYFDTVLIILDAIDESSPRNELLYVLRLLSTEPRFRKIRILATSREYQEIKEALNNISMPLSMANPLAQEDIARYVRQSLRSSTQFKHWPESLLQETEDTLAERAKGMYG